MAFGFLSLGISPLSRVFETYSSRLQTSRLESLGFKACLGFVVESAVEQGGHHLILIGTLADARPAVQSAC